MTNKTESESKQAHIETMLKQLKKDLLYLKYGPMVIRGAIADARKRYEDRELEESESVKIKKEN